MICRLDGRLVRRGEESVVVDIQGVGYQVFLSGLALGRLPPDGHRLVLEIHTHVREDALQLFGFLDAEEKAAFEALITMNGIGPRAAISLLSGIDARELARAVCAGDVARLCLIPGVGKKRAERMLVELKERLLPLARPGGEHSPSAVQTLDALRSALTHLGFKGAEVDAALSALRPRVLEGAVLESLMPEALRLIRG